MSHLEDLAHAFVQTAEVVRQLAAAQPTMTKTMDEPWYLLITSTDPTEGRCLVGDEDGNSMDYPEVLDAGMTVVSHHLDFETDAIADVEPVRVGTLTQWL